MSQTDGQLPEMTEEQAARKYKHMRRIAYIGVFNVVLIFWLLIPLKLFAGIELDKSIVDIVFYVVGFWLIIIGGGYYGMTNIRDAWGKR